MTTIYGIKNCDTVKKALKWLDNNGISYQFHDLRVDGTSDDLIDDLVSKSAWSELINKRSTTYRNLPENIKNNLTDDAAKSAVIEQPTLLKRPLLLINNQLHVGFKAENYQTIFAK
ncbi:ArsC family reductase [Thalassotalea fusca]